MRSQLARCLVVSALTCLAGGCQRSAAEVQLPPARATAQAAQPVHWSYQGAEGPSAWAALSPQYRVCGEGTAQSPIDLTGSQVRDVGGWKFDYGTTSLRVALHEHVTDILDNGHTLQVSIDVGSKLTTPRASYELKQFHFHTPSEHTVDGKSYPAEAHFLHQSAEGAMAVVAVFFEEGSENQNLGKLLAHVPARGQAIHLADTAVDLDLHVPTDNDAFEYMGSLTTPPCTEQVEWLLFRHPIGASPEQLAELARHMAPNNRPVQARHGRAVRLGPVVGRDLPPGG